MTNPFPLGQPGFTSHPIERVAHLRNDADKISALEKHPDARVYVLHRDSIVLTKEPNGFRAALTLAEAKRFGAADETVFLGLDKDAPRFGKAMSAASVEALAGRDDVVVDVLRGKINDAAIAASELSTIAIAKSLVSWHLRNGFCANCGSRTSMSQAGWKRDCPSCKTEHFPRTDPVVIMLVTHGDKCLLGRQAHFIPNMWSCLAGFVEVAETVENAVQREIFEESGIICTDVNYYMTQPWPYSSSLMIGCTARATTTDIIVDRSELEDARWFTRAEARTMMDRTHPDGMAGPHPLAIAHHLLGSWLQNEL
jgi:NAD+ diphosphatase